MHIFIKVGGRLRGERLSYLSMYLLYVVFVLFSQKFSRSLRSLFILHLDMQACNVFYQPNLAYIFGIVITDWQLPKFTETRIKLHKIAYKMAKNCL